MCRIYWCVMIVQSLSKCLFRIFHKPKCTKRPLALQVGHALYVVYIHCILTTLYVLLIRVITFDDNH